MRPNESHQVFPIGEVQKVQKEDAMYSNASSSSIPSSLKRIALYKLSPKDEITGNNTSRSYLIYGNVRHGGRARG
jgi:hypothetical protein